MGLFCLGTTVAVVVIVVKRDTDHNGTGQLGSVLIMSEAAMTSTISGSRGRVVARCSYYDAYAWYADYTVYDCDGHICETDDSVQVRHPAMPGTRRAADEARAYQIAQTYARRLLREADETRFRK